MVFSRHWAITLPGIFLFAACGGSASRDHDGDDGGPTGSMLDTVGTGVGGGGNTGGVGNVTVGGSDGSNVTTPSAGGTNSGGEGAGGFGASMASGGAATTGGGQADGGGSGSAGSSFEDECAALAAAAQDELNRIVAAEQPCESDSDCSIAAGYNNCAWLCPSGTTLDTEQQVELFLLSSCEEFDDLGCPEVTPPLCPNFFAQCEEGACAGVPG